MTATPLERFLTEPGSLNLPWVDSPFFDDLLATSGLSPDLTSQVRTFAENGYLIIDTDIPDKVMEGAISDLEGKYRPDSGFSFADEKRVLDGWIASRNLKRIASDAKILELLEKLYGRKPFPFQTINFCYGSEQRTHSDTIHFDSIPQGFMCGVWVALEDVDHRNGPLHYYPTSQKLPIYNMHDIGIAASLQTSTYENYSKYEDFVEMLMKARKLERLEVKMKRGQALVWSANLFHGGTPILDNTRTRYSQVTHYYFEGCLYYTPLMSDPALGTMRVKNVFNVADGRVVPQQYNGIQIENPGDWPPRIQSHDQAMLRVREEEIVNRISAGATSGPRPAGSFSPASRLKSFFGIG